MEAELPAEGRIVALPEEVLRSEEDALPGLVLVPPQQIDLDGAEGRGVLGKLPVEVVGIAWPERRVVVQDQVEPLHTLLLQTCHSVQRDADPVTRIGGQGKQVAEGRRGPRDPAHEDLRVRRPAGIEPLHRETGHRRVGIAARQQDRHAHPRDWQRGEISLTSPLPPDARTSASGGGSRQIVHEEPLRFDVLPRDLVGEACCWSSR